MSSQEPTPEQYLAITITVEESDAENVAGVGVSFEDPWTTVRIILSTKDHKSPDGGLVIRLLFLASTYIDRVWAIGDRDIFEEYPCHVDTAIIEVSGPARHIDAENAWLERGGEWYEIHCLDARDGFAMCSISTEYGVRLLRQCPHNDNCPEDICDAGKPVRQYVVLAGFGEKVLNVPQIVYKPAVEGKYVMKYPGFPKEDRGTKRARS